MRVGHASGWSIAPGGGLGGWGQTPPPPPPPQGCSRRAVASEVAPEALRQAVGGGCQSGLGAVTVGYECR